MQAKITKRSVDGLRTGQSLADTEVKGFVARRLPSGVVSYGFRYRDPKGKQRWFPLGLHGQVTPDQARDIARKRAAEVADGRDPTEERETARAVERNSLDVVIDSFLKRYVRARGLRSADQTARNFDRLVLPRLGTKSIYDIKRRDVIELLDEIEDASGAPTADQVLGNLRTAFKWWGGRDETFNSPIVAGMRRTSPKEQARSRILDDQELRDLWRALDVAPTAFADLVRVLLYTGQRRTEVAGMHATEVAGHVWTIPAARYKTKVDHDVPLTKAVLALLPARKGYLIGGRKPLTSFGRPKPLVDARIAELRKAEGRAPMAHWTLHDLRRTARSLMSRAGVAPDIAERTIGHAIPGIRGIYDRHRFLDEKRDALEKLAALIERIVNPAADNVIEFGKAIAGLER